MLRFAPSPTGEMHMGNLRLAIFNHIVSKQLNEDLLIRIDDTDKEKNVEGKDKDILEILSLFSIDYKGVVYQSENIKYHQKMAMQLMTQKKAFACFCSDEKLEELKVSAQNKQKPYEYDGFCSTLSNETVLNCNAPFTVRITKPIDNIQYKDGLKGEFTVAPFEVDSFVILNHDKLPTYNYACAVDDMLYNISTIIREEEHVENTPKQIHIRQALGYDQSINYMHLPSINDNGNSVKWLIEEGFVPSAIANYLVLLDNKTPTEIFTLEEAIQWFDINTVSKHTSTFDMKKLRHINKKHLEMMDDMRLSKILGFADTDIGKLGKLYLDKAHTIKELKSKIEAVFSSKSSCIGFEDEFNLIKESLLRAPFYNEMNELEQYIATKTQLKGKNLTSPLYFLLTGDKEGPDLSDIYPLIKNYLGEIVK